MTVSHDYDYPSHGEDREFKFNTKSKSMKEEELICPNEQLAYGDEFMLNHKNNLKEFFGVDSFIDNWGQEQIDYVNNVKPKKIRRFPSGAVRSDDTGRIRPDYLSPYAIAEIAEHFTTAKNDFGPTNYFLGIKPEEVIPSVMRHMLEIQEGLITGDKAMVRNGFRSLGANSIMALHQIVLEEKGLYKEKYNSTELVNADEYLKTLEDGKTN